MESISSMKLPKDSKLRPFEIHGVRFQGDSDTQAYGVCPFSGKDGKFYVNKETLLWDSKSAGLSGNLWKFLELKAEFNADDADLTRLAGDRSLPVGAFDPWSVGFDGRRYTIPSLLGTQKVPWWISGTTDPGSKVSGQPKDVSPDSSEPTE
jgi:hypothetical protein